MNHELKRLRGILNSYREKKEEQGAKQVLLQAADGKPNSKAGAGQAGSAGQRVYGQSMDYVDSPEAQKREEVLTLLRECAALFELAFGDQTT